MKIPRENVANSLNARRTEQSNEKTSFASFGEDLPSGYVEATYHMGRRGSEYRATMQSNCAVVLSGYL